MTTNTRPNQGDWGKDYIDVATRIAEFRSKYPNGSLQPVDSAEPIKIITVGDKTYLQYVAAAYRTPEDPRPGVGVAWEVFPGRTPFTRDSEAMVCETSAWGRAIVAVLAADTKKGIASAEEVRAAKARQSAPAPAPAPVTRTEPDIPEVTDGWQSADEDQPVRADAKQVMRIQILRKDIPSLEDDGVYHDRLLKAYGVVSTKDLTKAQASDLISKLEKSVKAAGK
jgi:hypothetical protein